MCGIFGILNPQTRPADDTVRRSLALIAHRGPDGDGVWRNAAEAATTGRMPFVALGHRRLAIIDLTEAGAQPMASADGRYRLVYNGEIYNYLELSDELAARGHRFQTRSDTEVVLRAYAEWGADCLARFNGMFAFAIWDSERHELFAARDRFGEKPLHYAWNPHTNFFAFASEIKALVALEEVDAALNERALYRYLAFQELAGAEETLWRGVKRLPHAHWLKLKWNGDNFALEIRRYWDIDLTRTSDMSLTEAARRYRELFRDSIRLRLRSDVPVGSSLSGGLDSSAVVCQIHELGAAGGQKTFSARMDDPALDEGEYIHAVLRQTGIAGYEIVPTAEELERLFARLCYHLEEPFLASSQFAQHLVMRLAHENRTTVLLDGQGADEMLAGYVPYFAARYSDLADARRVFTLWREWRGFRARHKRAFPLSLRAVAGRMKAGGQKSNGQVGAMNGAKSAAAQFRWQEMRAWWHEDWLNEFRNEMPRDNPDDLQLNEGKSRRRDRLTRKLYCDTMRGELQELLRYGDRNSMAWSRELRQPFLDHRLAELLFTLPPEFKLRDGETKLVLRAAVKNLIPRVIAERQDKLGFQAPLPAWLTGNLRVWTHERMEQFAADFAPFACRDAATQFHDAATQTMNEPAARAVFSLLTLSESQRQLNGVRIWRTSAAVAE